MTKRAVVTTNEAPRAIGPYSQAIRAGELLFVSGQIPLEPDSDALVTGDVATETAQVMKNLKAVLEAGGSSLQSVVKTTIYLTDMNDFAAANSAYGSFFENAPPARATVQVAALPKGARVEIDAIAWVGSSAAASTANVGEAGDNEND